MENISEKPFKFIFIKDEQGNQNMWLYISDDYENENMYIVKSRKTKSKINKRSVYYDGKYYFSDEVINIK